MADTKSKSKRSKSSSGSKSSRGSSGSKGSSRSKSTSSSKSSSGSKGSSRSKSRSGSSGSSGSSSRSTSSSSSGGSKKRSAREIAIDAVREVQDLMGRPVESVTGIDKNGNEWTVTLEVVELERIPNTTDVLGVYEVTVDKDGEMTGARRTRRFYRSEAGED